MGKLRSRDPRLRLSLAALSGCWARRYYPCISGSDVRHIHVQVPLESTPQHVAINSVDTTGCRCHVVVVVSKATSNTVINYCARIVGHLHVARSSSCLVLVCEVLHAFLVLGSVGTAHFETTQGRNIDNADIGTHRQHFCANLGLAVCLGSIVGRPPPLPYGHHLRVLL